MNMSWGDAELLIPSVPLGTEMRRTDGALGHVRAFVDGQLVIRWWRPAKQRWHYEVIGPAEISTGLWRVETRARELPDEAMEAPRWILALADEVGRLRTIIRNVATHTQHDYAGCCPDDIEGWDSRDPECPACRALMALDAEVRAGPPSSCSGVRLAMAAMPDLDALLILAVQLGHRKGYSNAAADVVTGELRVEREGPDEIPRASWQPGAHNCGGDTAHEWLVEAGLVPESRQETLDLDAQQGVDGEGDR